MEIYKEKQDQKLVPICNGNRTEWSPIRSVITKIGRPRSGSPICLQTELVDTKSYYQLIIKKLQFPRKEEEPSYKRREK